MLLPALPDEEVIALLKERAGMPGLGCVTGWRVMVVAALIVHRLLRRSGWL